MKDLNAAYAEILSQKKKIVPRYRRARDEMRELLTVKANVDRVLNMEAPEADAKKTTASVEQAVVMIYKAFMERAAAEGTSAFKWGLGCAPTSILWLNG